MILQSLEEYYSHLATQKDDSGKNAKVPLYGFSSEKISYILLLSKVGEIIEVKSNLSLDKKPRPMPMIVPRPEKRTSGVKPNFLWDKTAYTLGVKLSDNKEIAYSEETFAAFREFHLNFFAGIDNASIQSFCQFLKSWTPESFKLENFPDNFLDTNIVFQIDGDDYYLHEIPLVQKLWAEFLLTQSADKVQCLSDGTYSHPARLHPAIKGIWGGQSSGGAIVSFNKDAFESYEKKQGENAPVSEKSAFAYTTALNYLLNREHHQCLQIGDASTVFWALNPQGEEAVEEEMAFGAILDSVDENQENRELNALLEQVAKGVAFDKLPIKLDPDTNFYILGLAPNASRISIRFWWQNRFSELLKMLTAHFNDLQIKPLPWKKTPSIWQLLIQTVPLRNGEKRKTENIPAQLAGELMRAILTGGLYPRSIYTRILTCIRADGDISGLRVAMLKADLNRRYRKHLLSEEVPMGLDENNTNQAYLLGRLFAVLENIQHAALGDVNASLTDRYFASASTVPFSVFPRLLVGAKNHLSKIRKEKAGWAINLEKLLGKIIYALPAKYAHHLSLEDQGQFTIGYYHQRQDLFNRNSDKGEKE